MTPGDSPNRDRRIRLPDAAVVTSTNNSTIKQIRRLSLRKARERAGLCFVEGVRLVEAALRA